MKHRTSNRKWLLPALILGALATGCTPVTSERPDPVATAIASPGAAASTPSATTHSPEVVANSTPAAPTDAWSGAIEEINRLRFSQGSASLSWDDQLAQLAATQAVHYAGGASDWTGDFESDIGSLGFASGSGLANSGDSLTEVLDTWLQDADTSLLDPQFHSVGGASAPWPGGGEVYVILLAYRADDGSIPGASTGATEVLDLTNADRATHGLPALTLSEQLNAAAQIQADHQASNLVMTHDGNGGLTGRLETAGYAPRLAAENVAVGQTSLAAVVQAWIDSPGHHDNITNPDVTQMGFAVSFGSDGRAYYAQVFGAPL